MNSKLFDIYILFTETSDKQELKKNKDYLFSKLVEINILHSRLKPDKHRKEL
jgi:hypothetical protein